MYLVKRIHGDYTTTTTTVTTITSTAVRGSNLAFYYTQNVNHSLMPLYIYIYIYIVYYILYDDYRLICEKQILHPVCNTRTIFFLKTYILHIILLSHGSGKHKTMKKRKILSLNTTYARRSGVGIHKTHRYTIVVIRVP